MNCRTFRTPTTRWSLSFRRPRCTCTTASNYAHTLAGRAYVFAGYAYAVGSNQLMGLWNVFVTKTLKQTDANYYVIGTCP